MKELIQQLLNSGIGTIDGEFRACPKLSEEILRNPALDIQATTVRYKMIPDWFGVSLSDGADVHLGTIAPKTAAIEIAGHTLNFANITFYPEVKDDANTKNPWVVLPLAVVFEETPTQNPRSLTIWMEYHRDWNDLGNKHRVDYPFTFRAVLSQNFFWELVENK